MSYYEECKERVQVFVGSLAERIGLDPRQLTFKWEELEGSETSQVDASPDHKVQTVRVCFEKKWTTLIFPQSDMEILAIDPERILRGHRDEILEGLRRVKGLRAPVPQSGRLDRWAAEDSTFSEQQA